MEHVLQDASDTELIQKILWIICCYVVSSFEQAPEGRAPPGWSGLPVQAAACAGEPSRRARSRHLDWRYSTPCTVNKNQFNHLYRQFVSFLEAFLPLHHLDVLVALKVMFIVQWVQGS